MNQGNGEDEVDMEIKNKNQELHLKFISEIPEISTIHRDAALSHGPEEVEGEIDKNKDFEIIDNSQIKDVDLSVKEQNINKKALTKCARTYELEKFHKNAMIIFNFENIQGYGKRVGTNLDVASLCKTFSKFKFEIEVHNDCTKVDLFRNLKKFSDQNFTDYGCVAIAILTHGTNNGLLRAKDNQLFSEEDIINHFKVHSKQTLYTKPIVLMIQACRGSSTTRGAEVMQRAMVHRDQDRELESYYLPIESDILIFHSSYAGKPSFRPETGTWFIQTLCTQIDKLHRNRHLESIFTEVKREVAIENYVMERNRRTNEVEVNKQMPVVTSTLIRKLYLKSFDDYINTPSSRISFGNNGTNINEVDSLETSSSFIDSCYCYLNHFEYMKKCLSYIVQNNPKDTVAKYLLDTAKTQTDDKKSKTTLVAISNYLKKRYETSELHKYIYFYEDDCEIDGGDIKIPVEIKQESLFKRITKRWGEISQSSTVRCIGACVGGYVIFNFVKSIK